jgi:2'-5' RNA ligase
MGQQAGALRKLRRSRRQVGKREGVCDCRGRRRPWSWHRHTPDLSDRIAALSDRTRMTAPAPRYAVYFTPHPESALWRFGRDVVGYDSYSGGDRAPLVWGPLADVLAPEHLDEPARYGFHATLRAPFEPRPEATADALVAFAGRFAAKQQPVTLPSLVPQRMGGFLALTCPEPPAALAALAAACVTEFEAFRAPLSEADRKRRLQAKLTARQLAHLDAWGYPYVHDEFVFHMTLTGRLPPETAEQALARIAAAWGPLAGPHRVDAISILEQPRRDGPFRVLARLPLGQG